MPGKIFIQPHQTIGAAPVVFDERVPVGQPGFPGWLRPLGFVGRDTQVLGGCERRWGGLREVPYRLFYGPYFVHTRALT